MCGYELDNGHQHGPLGDYNYLCQTCERKLMQQHPEKFPLIAAPKMSAEDHNRFPKGRW